MLRIAYLKKSEDKKLKQNISFIPFLNCEVLVVSVPLKNKLKRKTIGALSKILQGYEYVLSEDGKLKVYERGTCDKSFLYFFLPEALPYLMRNAEGDCSAALVSVTLTDLFKKTLQVLGDMFQMVTVYTMQMDLISEYCETLFCSVGLPVKVSSLKCNTQIKERFLIRVTEDISVFDTMQKTEYIELKLKLLYPYTIPDDLPADRILKISLASDGCQKAVLDKKVKIIGLISK